MSSPSLSAIASSLRQSAFPKQLSVEVTARCNLRCAMCHHRTLKRPKGEMPLELFRKCADEIAALSPGTEVWLSFHGEPLLEPDRVVEMLAYAKSAGLRSVNLNTNGTLLDPALAERLLDSGLDLIVVGIDGLSAASYERIRVGGDRDRVYAHVEHLLAARHARAKGPEVMVQFIEMDENAHELEAFKAYWLAQGAAVKVRKKLSWGGTIATRLAVSTDQRIPCPWAINLMHVFWDGRVPPCPADTEGTDCVGNAWGERLAALWKHLAAHREKHLTRRFDLLPERCTDCKDWMVGAAEKIRAECALRPAARKVPSAAA